jgi:hypothetical protein
MASGHDATPEVQAQRTAAAADILRPINPDIILLQEVRDYETTEETPNIAALFLLNRFRIGSLLGSPRQSPK